MSLHPNLSGDRHGITFDRARDGKRLNRQAQAVFDAMKDGAWHTLAELSAITGAPEASASARIRDLKRPEFGGFTIEREYVRRGLWRYRLLLPRGQMEMF